MHAAGPGGHAGYHLFDCGGRTPLIDHTHFVGAKLYWHAICTTLGLMAAKNDVHAHTGRREKKLAFMNCFEGKIPPCTPQYM